MVASSLLFLFLPFALAVPSSTQTIGSISDHSQSFLQWQNTRSALEGIRQSIQVSLQSLWSETRSKSSHCRDHATPQVPSQKIGRYADQLVVRFNVSTHDDIKAIQDASDILFLDVWDQTEDWLDIRLRYDDVSSLLGLLPETLRTSHSPLLNGGELARAVQGTYPSSSSSSPFESSYRQRVTCHTDRSTRRANSDVFFNEYRSLAVITPWMHLLQSLFSTHVQTFTIGQSFEGRDIPALRIGVHPTNNAAPLSPRKTILITGGSHAREWVSTSTVNYIAHSLITSYGRRKSITHLLEQFDFVFIPTLNPDGYDYSWTTDRLWRKNRQPTSLRFCHGMDLDRTWSFKWDGSSSNSNENPCSEGYAGSEPLEAVESRALAQWAKNETEHNNVDFVGLLDLHSYSQQILYPYSYSCDEQPPNFEDLAEMAEGLAKAIRSKDHENYRALSACGANVAGISKASGASGGSLLDWFYHELHVHHAFQIKLRDKGAYGFLLPKEEIVPTGAEVVRAVEYFGRQLSSKYGGRAIELEWEEEFDGGNEELDTVKEGMYGEQKPLDGLR